MLGDELGSPRRIDHRQARRDGPGRVDLVKLSGVDLAFGALDEPRAADTQTYLLVCEAGEGAARCRRQLQSHLGENRFDEGKTALEVTAP